MIVHPDIFSATSGPMVADTVVTAHPAQPPEHTQGGEACHTQAPTQSRIRGAIHQVQGSTIWNIKFSNSSV